MLNQILDAISRAELTVDNTITSGPAHLEFSKLLRDIRHSISAFKSGEGPDDIDSGVHQEINRILTSRFRKDQLANCDLILKAMVSTQNRSTTTEEKDWREHMVEDLVALDSASREALEHSEYELFSNNVINVRRGINRMSSGPLLELAKGLSTILQHLIAQMPRVNDNVTLSPTIIMQWCAKRLGVIPDPVPQYSESLDLDDHGAESVPLSCPKNSRLPQDLEHIMNGISTPRTNVDDLEKLDSDRYTRDLSQHSAHTFPEASVSLADTSQIITEATTKYPEHHLVPKKRRLEERVDDNLASMPSEPKKPRRFYEQHPLQQRLPLTCDCKGNDCNTICQCVRNKSHCRRDCQCSCPRRWKGCTCKNCDDKCPCAQSGVECTDLCRNGDCETEQCMMYDYSNQSEAPVATLPSKHVSGEEGLFATRKITANSFIGTYKGQVRFEASGSEDTDGPVRLFRIALDGVLDPAGEETGVYYINHNTESASNAKFIYIETPSTRSVAAIATQDIAPGQEITAAYSPSYEENCSHYDFDTLFAHPTLKLDGYGVFIGYKPDGPIEEWVGKIIDIRTEVHVQWLYKPEDLNMKQKGQAGMIKTGEIFMTFGNCHRSWVHKQSFKRTTTVEKGRQAGDSEYWWERGVQNNGDLTRPFVQ